MGTGTLLEGLALEVHLEVASIHLWNAVHHALDPSENVVEIWHAPSAHVDVYIWDLPSTALRTLELVAVDIELVVRLRALTWLGEWLLLLVIRLLASASRT